MNNIIDIGKSLEKEPSPLITGELWFINFFTNKGITAAYAPLGSCRRPKTLKYRRPI